MLADFHGNKDCSLLLKKSHFQRLLWNLPGPPCWKAQMDLQESDFENITPRNIFLMGLNHGGDLGFPKALVEFMLKWI